MVPISPHRQPSGRSLLTEDNQVSDRDIFRTEALEHHRSGGHNLGDLLQLSPRWLGWTYRLLVLFFLAALAYLILGHMDEFATGPAVARQTDGGWSVLAVFPASAGEELQVGQEAWFQVEGEFPFRLAAKLMQIEDGVVGPTRADDSLGDDHGLPCGPVVRVIAGLQATGDSVEQLTDGSRGTLRVWLRATPVLLHLIPALGAFDSNEGEAPNS